MTALDVALLQTIRGGQALPQPPGRVLPDPDQDPAFPNNAIVRACGFAGPGNPGCPNLEQLHTADTWRKMVLHARKSAPQ